MEECKSNLIHSNEAVNSFFERFLCQMKKKNPIAGNDYEKDGLIYCGDCHKPKQAKIPYHGEEITVPIACECPDKTEKAIAENEKINRIKNLRFENIGHNGCTSHWLNCTFENDNNSNKRISEICKKYVKNFSEMYKLNQGILFFGNVRVGKSFFALAIANALIDKGINCYAENIVSLANQYNNYNTKERTENIIANVELLVIDDLGAERNTSTQKEAVFQIIENRINSNKPMIITTNLSLKEMQTSADLQERRIYSRVYEACPLRIGIKDTGLAVKLANEKTRKAKEILGI